MLDGYSDEDDARGVAAWSRLMHIGAHEGDTSTRPGLAELGVDEVHRVCVRAWKYSRNDFEPDTFAELRRSQWRETCALAGSMAESLMLGSAAYVEAVWHQRAIGADTEPAGMALAQRYLADGAIDNVVSVGHRLANFVVRVARTSPTAQAALDRVEKLRPLGPIYVPFATDDPSAWLSLNGATVTRLRNVLDPKLHTAPLDALDSLVASSEWVVAVGNRAENFHRWRKEHEYVTGVDAESGNARDIYDATNQHIGRAVGGHGRRHKISDGLTARTTDAAGEGLRRIAQTLDIILTNTVDLVLPTQHDGFTVEIDDPNRIGTRRRTRST
ncbi:hypothetical protein [Gordonia rhizosphera]|uniref:Uncharacterized protein n=1 Tax=Gordonia rhizosphera NBRC 16068 TaxID=1108045 RepID=K6W7H7_9ACTN|nr:hypothetical protein [Gordonia rhizosphera]GAB88172.1 hypothetical protein GORHZ_006_00410 [Gordonia rhizosphera NBRC 16068]